MRGDLWSQGDEEQFVEAFKRRQASNDLLIVSKAIQRCSDQLTLLLDTRRKLVAALAPAPTTVEGFPCRVEGCDRVLANAGGRASHERSHGGE